MTKDQAIKLLSQVCAAFKGTLEDHQMLQEALGAVSKLEEPKPAVKKQKA